MYPRLLELLDQVKKRAGLCWFEPGSGRFAELNAFVVSFPYRSLSSCAKLLSDPIFDSAGDLEFRISDHYDDYPDLGQFVVPALTSAADLDRHQEEGTDSLNQESSDDDHSSCPVEASVAQDPTTECHDSDQDHSTRLFHRAESEESERDPSPSAAPSIDRYDGESQSSPYGTLATKSDRVCVLFNGRKQRFWRCHFLRL